MTQLVRPIMTEIHYSTKIWVIFQLKNQAITALYIIKGSGWWTVTSFNQPGDENDQLDYR